MPRWTFEKFPEADETLTTQMKSVGEAMSIGRTFKESLQKAIRSMEVKRFGLGLDRNDAWLAGRRDGAGAGDGGGDRLAPSSGRSPRTSSSASSACRARGGCTTSGTRCKMGWPIERIARADGHRSVVPRPDRSSSSSSRTSSYATSVWRT